MRKTHPALMPACKLDQRGFVAQSKDVARHRFSLTDSRIEMARGTDYFDGAATPIGYQDSVRFIKVSAGSLGSHASKSEFNAWLRQKA